MPTLKKIQLPGAPEVSHRDYIAIWMLHAIVQQGKTRSPGRAADLALDHAEALIAACAARKPR